MKKLYIAAIAVTLAASAMAKTQLMHITLSNGITQTINVAEIKEMTFSEEADGQAQGRGHREAHDKACEHSNVYGADDDTPGLIPAADVLL